MEAQSFFLTNANGNFSDAPGAVQAAPGVFLLCAPGEWLLVLFVLCIK